MRPTCKIAPLFRKQGVPAGSPRRHEGRSDLIAHRRQAAIVRPTVDHELDEPKPLSRHEDISSTARAESGTDSLEICNCGVPLMM